MFLRKGFNGKFIICAMFASLLSVHVAYAADPVEAIEIDESGNCVAEHVENAAEVHWDSGTNTCIVDTCKEGYTLHEDKCIKSCEGETLNEENAKTGYMQDDKCILTVCADGYDLDAGENKCKVRQSGGGSGTPVNEDCGKNLFNPQLLSEGGFTYNSGTYTFTGKFDRRFDATTHANTGDFVSNYYMTNYSYGLQPNTAYKLVYTINCATDSNSVTSQSMIMGLLTKANGSNTVIKSAPTVGSCSNGSVTVTVSGGSSTTSVVGVYVGRASGVSNDYSGNLTISNVMLVLNSESTSTMIPYGPCIKISTKMATATRATGVEERLSNVRSIISDLITRTQDNADGINGLQSSKQTRPVDANACPSNKTCLLVKDTAGHNNWYEIMTCGLDSFLAGITSVEQVLGYGWKTSGGVAENLCGLNDVNCQNGEWATSYDSGIIYGKAKAVPIAERTYGQIVSLPSNAPTGNVCLCKVTGYRERTVNGQTVTYGTRKSVTTDKWTVTWARGNTDDACLAACADDVEYPDNGVNGPKGGYYSNISNTCSSAAPSATMCQYNRYLDLIVANAPDSGNVGFETPLGSGNQGYDQICDHSPDTIDNTWCNTANDMSGGAPTWEHNTWIAKLPAITLSGTGEPNVPELYGRAYCTYKDTTTLNQYDVLNQSEIGTVEPTGVMNTNTGYTDVACVCKLTGYRNAGAAQVTNISSSKYLFVGGAQGKCNYDCQKMCADAFAQDADNNLMHQLADSCVAN